MPTEKDPTQEIQGQVLDGIRKSQEAVIDGMRAWTETSAGGLPPRRRSATFSPDRQGVPAACHTGRARAAPDGHSRSLGSL